MQWIRNISRPPEAERNLFKRALHVSTPVCLLIVAWIYRQEIADGFAHAFDVGWVFLLLFPLFLLWNFAAAAGWHKLIRAVDRKDTLSSVRLSLIRLTSQSVNMVLPFSMGAPVLKTSFLAAINGSVAKSAATVALDTLAATLVSVLFSLLVLGLNWELLPGGALCLSGVSVALVSAGVLFLLSSPRRLFAQRFERMRERSTLGRALELLRDADGKIKGALGACILFHAVEQLLMAYEIWVIARGLGVALELGQCAFAAAVMNGFTFFFFFIPGQVGAAEGGLATAFALLGLPPEAGLGVGFVRRARQTVVYGVGLLVLFCSKSRSAIQALRKRAPDPCFDFGSSPNDKGNDNATFVPSTR